MPNGFLIFYVCFAEAIKPTDESTVDLYACHPFLSAKQSIKGKSESSNGRKNNFGTENFGKEKFSISGKEKTIKVARLNKC